MAQEVIFANRQATSSLKWDGYEGLFGAKELLPLWVADMDFEVCDPIKRAIEARHTHSVFGYPHIDDGFFDAIIYWHKRRYGEVVKREWIVTGVGVAGGIFAALEAFSEKGDGALIMPPVYGPFFAIPRALGRKIVEMPLSWQEGEVGLDFGLLENILKEKKPKVAIFCHPHNPLGKAWKPDELAQIGALCSKYGCLVVSDEIHSDIVYRGVRHQPFYTINDECVCLFAPTKSFNIPGLNVSYAIIKNEKIRKKYENIAHSMHATLPNAFGIEALKAAYLEGEEWLESLLIKLESNKKTVVDFLKDKPYALSYEPQATYLAWIDFAPSGLDASQIRKKLLNEAKVALSGGDFFYGGKSTTCHRLNFATSQTLLTQGLESINRAFVN
jgi:cysteine-S-conjugate beta-lyase